MKVRSGNPSNSPSSQNPGLQKHVLALLRSYPEITFHHASCKNVSFDFLTPPRHVANKTDPAPNFFDGCLHIRDFANVIFIADNDANPEIC
jgi:hypothetical protein